MAKRFEGKVAIVTGASSGMGLATATQLATEGAKVLLVARSKDKLDAATSTIKAKGGDVTPFVADVTKDEENAAFVAAAVSAYGRLDIAFLNAGVYAATPVSEVTENFYNKVFDVNTKSVAFGLKHILPAIEKSGGGGSVIVNSSGMALSARATPAFAGGGIYSASKAAADLIAQYAAVEAWKHKTRVNVVAPGIVSTGIMGEGVPDQVYQDFAAPLQLVGRAGRPEEVATLVCYLASDEASFVTGSIHAADGGWLLKA